LKAPGFNPCTVKVISWLQACASKCNWCRYTVVTPAGILLVADTNNHRVRSIGIAEAGLHKLNPADP
jgi:hypothetical protein